MAPSLLPIELTSTVGSRASCLSLCQNVVSPHILGSWGENDLGLRLRTQSVQGTRKGQINRALRTAVVLQGQPFGALWVSLFRHTYF